MFGWDLNPLIFRWMFLLDKSALADQTIRSRMIYSWYDRPRDFSWESGPMPVYCGTYKQKKLFFVFLFTDITFVAPSTISIMPGPNTYPNRREQGGLHLKFEREEDASELFKLLVDVQRALENLWKRGSRHLVFPSSRSEVCDENSIVELAAKEEYEYGALLRASMDGEEVKGIISF